MELLNLIKRSMVVKRSMVGLIYNGVLYFSSAIQRQYREKYGRFKFYGRGVEHNVSNSPFVYSYGSGHKIMCP